MTASARFHRLFTSGGGYTLFMPAVFKVYAEAESNEGVRRAIEYGINRFYAVHQEAFVFQVLNMLSHVVMLPEVDGPWVAKQIFLLLSTLKDDTPVYAADAAGIHGSNKTQEQEALLLRTAEERPQAFLTLLRRNSGSQGEDIGFTVPDQYDGGHLSLDNFVRLLLTVIGHDPSIRRAEQFLRLLRLMAPYFYDASPTSRGVLQEGINALSHIFISRSTGKTKSTENPQTRVEEPNHSFSQAAGASIDAFEAARSPSNFTEMKHEYLSLAAEFSNSGGSFGSSALRRILELVKMMLRDSDPVSNGRVASFLGSFAHNILVRNASDLPLKQVVTFLTEVGPIFKTYSGAADFSKMLEVVLHLVENPVYANQPTFSLAVITHYCAAGLDVFERLASDGYAFSFPLRPLLVRLLCRATLLIGIDVMNIIEQRPITFEFVAGILYPMAVTLPSVAEIASDTRWMEAWRRVAIRRAWICLVQLAMQACQRQGPTNTSDRTDKSSLPERRRSQEKKRNVVKNYPAATLSMALQTLKVIVVKAEDELSLSLPSIWVQMGLLLKNVLSTGNAKFAITEKGASVPTSPVQPFMNLKPRTSEDSDIMLTPLSPRVASSRIQSPLPTTCPQPSIIDYLLWSILEFVCRRRSPLMLQMRLFLQEATATLDKELYDQQAPVFRRKHASYVSVFAKTPQRSGRLSKSPSPEASPFLSPIPPNHGDFLLTPPKPERKPGYARSPTTPGGSEALEPRIVHLGPIENFDLLHRSPSPGLGEGGAKSRRWLMANSTTIRSAKLVLATYRRIRAVQRIMGYTELLSAPDDAEESVNDVRVWSRGTALSEIEDETTDLMEEFWLQDD
jgi:Protein UNC80